MHRCTHCGGPLRPRQARFCSDACRKAFKAAEKKEEFKKQVLDYWTTLIQEKPHQYSLPEHYRHVQGLRSDRDLVHLAPFMFAKEHRYGTLCDPSDQTVRITVGGRWVVTCPECHRIWRALFDHAYPAYRPPGVQYER